VIFAGLRGASGLPILEDAATEYLSPELVRGVVLDALHRGLVRREELSGVEAALETFGGLRS